MTSKTKQQGFSIVPVVLLVIIIGLVGLIGWRVISTQKSVNKSVDVSAKQQTNTTQGSTSTSDIAPIKSKSDIDKVQSQLDTSNLESDLESSSLDNDISSIL